MDLDRIISSFLKYQKDECGSVLIVSLFFLMLLTLVGIAASTTSQIELRISGNEKFHKLAFYAAEAARGYVASRPELYDAQNIDVGRTLSFPDMNDDSVMFELNPKQSFKGSVKYLGASIPPRGSGNQVGTFKAHKYQMICTGFGPANAEKKVEAGFYRLGF